MPEPTVNRKQPRRVYITKRDVLQYGPTPGCKGCQAAMRGEETSVNHSEECRERLTRLLEDAELTKAVKAKARVQEKHEDDIEMDVTSTPQAEPASSSGTVRKAAADSDRGGGHGGA